MVGGGGDTSSSSRSRSPGVRWTGVATGTKTNPFAPLLHFMVDPREHRSVRSRCTTKLRRLFLRYHAALSASFVYRRRGPVAWEICNAEALPGLVKNYERRSETTKLSTLHFQNVNPRTVNGTARGAAPWSSLKVTGIGGYLIVFVAETENGKDLGGGGFRWMQIYS